MKKKTTSQLKKQADKIFSMAIRLRDSDEAGRAKCITCPTVKHWKDMHCGHFVKRSVNLLRYDYENCNAQCPQCNVYKYGEQYAYSKALDDKYGAGTADKLMDQRFTSHKFTTEELEDIISTAQEEVKFYKEKAL